MKSRVVIIIPIYKAFLNKFEKIALQRVFDVLGKYSIIFVAPDQFKFNYGEIYKAVPVEYFNDFYFSNINGYNQLVLSPIFYMRFKRYEYILIYQLDAFVFSDQLLYFCNLGYDYIGAPWEAKNKYYYFQGIRYRSHVGNGGVSLRNVDACLYILKKYRSILSAWTANEDCFFSYCGDFLEIDFKIAPKNVASKFSFEWFPEHLYKKNKNQLAFACHAWMNFSRDFYLDIFQQCGVDLWEYSGDMKNIDLDYEKERYIKHVDQAIMRQNYSLDFLRKYGQEWSVFGFGKYGAILIRWLLDSGFRIKCIFDNNKDKQGDAYCGINIISPADIQPGTEKILITNFKYEEEIIQELMAQGLIYGRDFVSFRKEYMRSICYLRNWA